MARANYSFFLIITESNLILTQYSCLLIFFVIEFNMLFGEFFIPKLILFFLNLCTTSFGLIETVIAGGMAGPAEVFGGAIVFYLQCEGITSTFFDNCGVTN